MRILTTASSLLLLVGLAVPAMAKNHTQPADAAEFGQSVASDAIGEVDEFVTREGKGVDGRNVGGRPGISDLARDRQGMSSSRGMSNGRGNSVGNDK